MSSYNRGAEGRAAQLALRAAYAEAKAKAKGASEPPVVIYAIDNWQFARLLEIQKRLDGRILTPAGRRVLANALRVLTDEIKDLVR